MLNKFFNSIEKEHKLRIFRKSDKKQKKPLRDLRYNLAKCFFKSTLSSIGVSWQLHGQVSGTKAGLTTVEHEYISCGDGLL